MDVERESSQSENLRSRRARVTTVWSGRKIYLLETAFPSFLFFDLNVKDIPIVRVLTSTTHYPQLWHDTDECLIISQRYLSHKHKPQTRANEDRISVLLIWRRKNTIPDLWLVSWASIPGSDWSCHHPDQAGSASPNTRVWVSLYYGGDTISGSMGLGGRSGAVTQHQWPVCTGPADTILSSSQ